MLTISRRLTEFLGGSLEVESVPGRGSTFIFTVEVPIIALTAFAMAGDEERFRTAGMNGYVTKPVNWAELARVIRELPGTKP